MTAITTAPATAARRKTQDDVSALLRVALRADATLCASLGLLIAMTADPLSTLSGLTATAEFIGGAMLVGYGALLYLLAGLPHVRRVGTAVLAGNIAYTVAVVVVLVGDFLPLTEFGVAATIAFTAATLGFAYAQYLGVRRLGATPS